MTLQQQQPKGQTTIQTTTTGITSIGKTLDLKRIRVMIDGLSKKVDKLKTILDARTIIDTQKM